MSELPNLDLNLFDNAKPSQAGAHKPRILLLYGSTRERSFSRLLVEEAARLLEHFGAETRIFNPSGLPLPDDVPVDHPKVQELRELVLWSEGQVWCSPERHGAMSAVFKAQIDWIPLELGAVRPTQGKTLAVMQVCGGSQSFKRGQPVARVGPLDAHVHHPQPILGAEGLHGVRRHRADESVAVLRSCGGCNGRTGEVHRAAA